MAQGGVEPAGVRRRLSGRDPARARCEGTSRDSRQAPCGTGRTFRKRRAQAHRHRRPQPLPASSIRADVGADPGTAHEPVVVQRRDPQPAAAARAVTPTTSRWTPRDASWFPLRFANTPSSTITSCSWARATSSSSGTKRSGRRRRRARSRSLGRSAAGAGRLQPLMAGGDHVPVLLEEAIAALAIRPDGTYVDATLRPRRTLPRDPRRARAGRTPLRLRSRSGGGSERARHRRSTLSSSARAGSPSSRRFSRRAASSASTARF